MIVAAPTWEWVEAPWTDQEVRFLAVNQNPAPTDHLRPHPYTCDYCRDVLDVEGTLVPYNDGWYCTTHPDHMPQPVQTTALLLVPPEMGPLDHIFPGHTYCGETFGEHTCVLAPAHTANSHHICGEPTCNMSWPHDVCRKTPRNALCPCDSGKKFKHCHGRGRSRALSY